MAINAVIAVRAGPEIARQSNRMPVLPFPHKHKSGRVTISCFSAQLSGSIPNKRLTGPQRLSDLLDRMISIADGTGFHIHVLALDFGSAFSGSLESLLLLPWPHGSRRAKTRSSP